MYCGANSLSTSTPRRDFGKSRTWPTEAVISKPGPSMPASVRALAGDSTMTRSWFPLRDRRAVVLAVALPFAAFVVARLATAFLALVSVGVAGLLLFFVGIW